MNQEVDFYVLRCPDGTRLSGKAKYNTATGDIRILPGFGIHSDSNEWKDCIKEYGVVMTSPGVFSRVVEDEGKWRSCMFKKLLTPSLAYRVGLTEMAPEPFLGFFEWEFSKMVKDTGLAEDQGKIHTAEQKNGKYVFVTRDKPSKFLVEETKDSLSFLLELNMSFKSIGNCYFEVETQTGNVEEMIAKFRMKGIKAGPLPS